MSNSGQKNGGYPGRTHQAETKPFGLCILLGRGDGEGDLLSVGDFKGVPVRVGQKGPIADRIA